LFPDELASCATRLTAFDNMQMNRSVINGSGFFQWLIVV